MAAGKREFCGISLVYCGLCPTSFRGKKRKGKEKGKREKEKKSKKPTNKKNPGNWNLKIHHIWHLSQMELPFSSLPCSLMHPPLNQLPYLKTWLGKVLIFLRKKRVKIFNYIWTVKWGDTALTKELFMHINFPSQNAKGCLVNLQKANVWTWCPPVSSPSFCVLTILLRPPLLCTLSKCFYLITPLILSPAVQQ